MKPLVSLSILVGLALGLVAPPVEEDLRLQEQVLARQRIKTDGLSLLGFFRARTLSTDELDQLSKWVRQLGADTFVERNEAQQKLIQAGRKAVPLLLQARNDPDLEIARRARACLRTVDSQPETEVVLAAAEVLAARHPAGACETLLAYLPFLEEERAEEDYFSALTRVSFARGKALAAVVNAREARLARQRRAAAWVLGRSPHKEDRDQAVTLLRDQDASVRYRAAEALLFGRDARGVPELIALLAKGPLDLARQAESLLIRLAEEHGPRETLVEDEAKRAQCHAAWLAWWREHQTKVDLARLELPSAFQGLRLVIANSGYGGSGAVWEYGPGKRTIWEMRNVGGPFDARILPGGKILLAEYNARKVSERDRNGKILWEHRLANGPLEVQRLPNGNTFLATNYELLEVTREGKVVFSKQDNSGKFFSGQKLPNGNILYGLYTGAIVEIDRSGKEVLRFPIERPRGLANIVPLPGGRYLMPLAGSGRIVEMDCTGKVTREINLPGANSVALLPGGNLLVGSHLLNNVREIDARGNVLWEQKAQGQIFRVRAR